jgi:hypothetical protein
MENILYRVVMEGHSEEVTYEKKTYKGCRNQSFKYLEKTFQAEEVLLEKTGSANMFGRASLLYARIRKKARSK